MSIDRAFLCLLVKETGFSVVSQYALTPDMFINSPDRCQDAFELIKEFFVKYGKMPEIETVEKNLPDPSGNAAELKIETQEPIGYYADKIRDRWLSNILVSHEDKYNRSMGEMDPKAALAHLEQAVALAKSKLSTTADTGLVDLRETTEERMKSFQRRKELGGRIDGLEFPWPALNEATMGIHPGELWFIVARMKTGKTWSEVCLAKHFFTTNRSVLFVTMEMPISKLSQRTDAVYSKLPYRDFKKGTLTTEQIVKYSRDLEEWKSETKPPFWICGKGRIKTPQDLDLLIEEKKPDVVIIDGIYLMRVSGKAGSKWEKVATIADELQDIAQRRLVPIIATSQFNRKVKKDTLDAGAEDLGFSYEIGQNADALIGMFQTEDMRTEKKMVFRLLEHREGEPVSFEVSWDFDQMNFDQIAIIKEEAFREKGGGDEEVAY